MMEKKGKITILVSEDGARFEIRDKDSAITFLTFTMSAEDFMAALGRLANVPITMQLQGIDKLGKKMELTHITFPEPEDCRYRKVKNVLHETAQAILDQQGEGWEVSDGFSSQNTRFIAPDGTPMIRCGCRRWVATEESDEKKD